ncbi:CcoQ/FixQ family Cbb3-type cytochrome c oxidase assembly chaperone [Gammaproteobacteria bacterium]|jgi:cytochrome c oxidase cbb3-type subunit 4|nr:CcoQ/FixQ family Cbb3-type cytochrome c oxidase assembly chaperone [Gammaproteobacteria bacterium]
MDINTLRGLLTLVLMLAFVGVWIWAWSKRRNEDFSESAALPLEEDQHMTNHDRENV